MKQCKVALVGFLLTCTACVSVNSSVLTTDFQAQPVPQSEVQVFFADDTLPEHTRVAILDAEGSSGATDRADMIDKLREEAGKHGANAIHLQGIEDPGTGEKALNAVLFGVPSGERKGQAVAIYCPSLDEKTKSRS